MAIDLPGNASSAWRSLQNTLANTLGQRQEAMQAALGALNIKEGEVAHALVKAVNAVDERLRSRLITLANPAVAADSAGKRRPATLSSPSASLEVNSLAALLKSASLKLVELEIRGRPLLTLTDQPLRPDSQVQVQLRQGQLTLSTPTDNWPQTAVNSRVGAGLSLPGPALSGDKSGQSGSNLVATQPAIREKPIGSSAAETRPAQAPAVAARALYASHIQALTQALRTRLPQQTSAQTIGQTLELAATVSQLLTQPVNRNLRAQIPASIQASLRNLASFLRSHEQLSQPAQLRQTLMDSGVQMEHRLAQAAGKLKLSAGADKAGIDRVLRQLVNIQMPRADLKAALEVLAKQLGDSQMGKPGTGGAPPQPFISLLRQLVLQSGTPQAVTQQLSKEQLLAHLQQQVNQALDKIVVQQMQTLQRAVPGNEQAPTQHWQLEIPLRYGHEVHQLQLRIDEEWVHENAEEERQATRRIQQWLVKLAFELPDAGTLHAHLRVQDNSVSASVWAENTDTLELARRKVQQLKRRLEDDGVSVGKIECFCGRPAQDDIQLNYSLVDIKT